MSGALFSCSGPLLVTFVAVGLLFAGQLTEKRLTAGSSDSQVTGEKISPDGKYLAFNDTANGMSLVEIDTGKTRTFANAHSMDPLGWLRDGQDLLLRPAGKSEVWKMSLSEGVPRKFLEDVTDAFPSPDGRRLAFVKASSPQEIWVMDSAGGEPRRITITDSANHFSEVDWSPNGKRIFYTLRVNAGSSWTYKIESCDIELGQCNLVLEDPKLMASGTGQTAITWLPDNRVIFSRGDPPPHDRDTNLWSVAVDQTTGRVLGKPKRITTWSGYSLSWLGHSAGGKRLVMSRTSEQNVVLLAATNAVPAGSANRAGPDDSQSFVGGWTGDSKAIVRAFYRDGIWSIDKSTVGEDAVSRPPAGKSDLWPLVTHSSTFPSPVATPDGQWVLYRDSAGDGTSRLVRVRMDGGGSATILLTRSSPFGYACSTSNTCLLEESRDSQIVFSDLDPVNGLKSEVARVTIPKDFLARTDRPWWSPSPDGASIAIVGASQDKNAIRIVSLKKGAVRELQVNGASGMQTVGWAADGNSMFVTDVNLDTVTSRLLRVSLSGASEIVREISLQDGWLNSPFASPDGRYVVFGERTFRTHVLMLENF
jgi:Tol biopolymer transport system component